MSRKDYKKHAVKHTKIVVHNLEARSKPDSEFTFISIYIIQHKKRYYKAFKS